MRFRIKHTFVLLLTVAAVFSRPAAGQVSQAPSPEQPLRSDVALDYSYLRTNAPPGGCTCFNMNGGSASYTGPAGSRGFAFAADFTFERAISINGTSNWLNIGTLTVGARYFVRMHRSPLRPFGEVLVGGAHAVGSLAKPPNPLYNNSEAAFTAILGGGLDMRLNRRFSLRLAEADYFPTTFDNGSNNHQNNFRLGAGAVIHF
jgi:peptidoglycan-associated lipoprotein